MIMVKMDHRNHIYSLINEDLKEILEWSFEPSLKEKFDLDATYHELFKEYNINMDFGFLYPIYVLVDIFCDSLRHREINISRDYTITEARNDLQYIIDLISAYKISELESDISLAKKLQALYDE